MKPWGEKAHKRNAGIVGVTRDKFRVARAHTEGDRVMDEQIIRKVKVLKGRAKDEAVNLGLDPDDLVIVTVTTNPFPEYQLEKVEGDPISFLLKHDKSITS